MAIDSYSDWPKSNSSDKLQNKTYSEEIHLVNSKEEIIKTVIFRLYFKTIFRQND